MNSPGFRIRIDLMRIRIRIQHFFLLRIRIPDPDPGFDDIKLKKIYSWKFNFYFLDCKNCNLLIPRPPERTPKLQEKPSAVKREHPVLKNMNSGFFSIWWVIFALLDPDPDPTTQINADPCGSGYGSGSKTLVVVNCAEFTLSLGLHKGRPSYRRSLPPSKENIQHFKT